MARCGIAIALLLIGYGLTAARSADGKDQVAARLDRPLEVKRVPAKSEADPAGEIRCTYFADLMIVETGTDSPAPGPAAIVPFGSGAPRVPCRIVPPGQGTPLNTENYSFMGRKGPFLLFEATDPNGAVPFNVLSASTGRSIYSDATTGRGFRSIGLEDGALHLRYTRGFNGGCSILKDGQACWTKMAQEAKFPPTVAHLSPPIPACAATYRKTKTPADDPNVISYALDLTVDGSGKTRVNSVGALGCSPLP